MAWGFEVASAAELLSDSAPPRAKFSLVPIVSATLAFVLSLPSAISWLPFNLLQIRCVSHVGIVGWMRDNVGGFSPAQLFPPE